MAIQIPWILAECCFFLWKILSPGTSEMGNILMQYWGAFTFLLPKPSQVFTPVTVDSHAHVISIRAVYYISVQNLLYLYACIPFFLSLSLSTSDLHPIGMCCNCRLKNDISYTISRYVHTHIGPTWGCKGAQMPVHYFFYQIIFFLLLIEGEQIQILSKLFRRYKDKKWKTCILQDAE